MSSSRILQIKRKPFHYIHAEDLMVYEAIRVLDCVSDLELVRSQIRGGHLLWGMLQKNTDHGMLSDITSLTHR